VQAVWKEDYHETLLDGLNIFYNPFASVPVPFGAFDRPDITQHTYDIQERLPVSFAKKGNLIQRTVMKMVVREGDKDDVVPE
jgi:hypothetical protein